MIGFPVVKMAKIPVHCALTKRKLSILNSLTARTTYGVWLWAQLFREHRLKGSCHTERLTQSISHCWNCELVYNADFNAAMNIGSRFLATPLIRWITDDLADAGDEQAREIVACDPRSPHLFMGGS